MNIRHTQPSYITKISKRTTIIDVVWAAALLGTIIWAGTLSPLAGAGVLLVTVLVAAAR